ncbi:MAG: endonuclease [Arcobacter sp.]|nr:endonuclease [Arcobacter sp.]
MKLRFGTFNLFQFVEPPYSWYVKKDKFSPLEWNEKVSWIKEQIINMNCDIIGFQEVFSKDALKTLTKDLGFEYFITVQDAKVSSTNPNVFISTTLALASKHPILEIQKVKPNGKSILKHEFEGHFSFSRTPIKALIKLPNEQSITIYVNHFKSNRLNEYEYIFTKQDSLEDKKNKIKDALKNNYSKALKQRLCETSSLYYDIKKTNTPVILMCDLNDKEFSITIDALTNKAYHENRKKDLYILDDAYYLYDKKIYNPHPNQKEIRRTATSYFQGVGNVLDYIFVSKEFNKKNKNALASITSYEIFNQHLEDNPHGSILKSDHAQVVCEVEFKSS